MAGIKLIVFTHPACSGCGDAVKSGWELSQQYPELDLETCSLETKQGLEQANNSGIKLIPTLIFYKNGEEHKRFVGQTALSELKAAYQDMTNA